MNYLFYPTVDLFTYDIQNALNLDLTQLNQQSKIFRDKLPQGVQFYDSGDESEYLELTIPKKPVLIPDNKSLEGYYYPVRLNDVYALQIDCSVNNLAEPQLIDSFAAIKTEIESKIQQSSVTIGQTWFISGWLTESEEKNALEIAKSCYQSLFKGQEWQQYLYSSGSFLTGNFFEIWQTQSYPHNHVIIVLFPDRPTAERAASFYTDWMGLFCYRHKVTWAYHQSRLVKKTLVNHYRQVEQNSKLIKQNNNSITTQKLLNNIQDVLNQYTVELLNLTFQKQIIEINLINYQRRVEIIQQKLGQECNVDYLNKFSNYVENKYLEQIVKDTENMQLGIRLLEDNLNAMNSRIELEKSERDRIFQALVTIIGTGMAGASLVQSSGLRCKTVFSSALWICQPPLISRLAIPILLIMIFGVVGWLIAEVVSRSKKVS